MKSAKEKQFEELVKRGNQRPLSGDSGAVVAGLRPVRAAQQREHVGVSYRAQHRHQQRQTGETPSADRAAQHRHRPLRSAGLFIRAGPSALCAHQPAGCHGPRTRAAVVGGHRLRRNCGHYGHHGCQCRHKTAPY